ncbi:MAG: LuxR C-terminal-related transcriptional regulator [Pseudomonadota bacterium]
MYDGYGEYRETSGKSVSEMSWNEILGGVADPVAVLGWNYEIVWANRTLLSLLGSDLAHLGRRACYELILKRDRRCPDCPVSLVFGSGKPAVMEKSFRCGGGSVVWKEVRAYPIRSVRGDVVGAVRIGFDITQRKLLADRLARHVEALERTLSEIAVSSDLRPPSRGASECAHGLTDRELQVLRLLAGGLSNTEISGILKISPHTVKSHVMHIFHKLGVAGRTDAAVTAVNLKLI